MKKIIAAILLVALPLCANAFSLFGSSDTVDMTVDGKNVRIHLMSTPGDNHVYHSKDFEKGVYVVATLWSSSTEVLPNTTALIRDYLRSRGVNVVDKIDGTMVALKFEVQDLNIDGKSVRADTASSNQHGSLSVQGADLATKGSIIATAAKVGGPFSGVLAYSGASSYHYDGQELNLSARGVADPTIDKLGDNISDYTSHDSGIVARWRPNKAAPGTSTGDVLTVMMKVWVDKFYAQD